MGMTNDQKIARTHAFGQDLLALCRTHLKQMQHDGLSDGEAFATIMTALASGVAVATFTICGKSRLQDDCKRLCGQIRAFSGLLSEGERPAAPAQGGE
jgi:hypothetical protein